LVEWRKHLDAPGFIQAWERRLAFRGEWVNLMREGQEPLEGQVQGLNADGSLRLRLRSGETTGFQFGEIRLRPPAQAL
jgi:biotin-(acetyl-CoA carboxylase) ligase